MTHTYMPVVMDKKNMAKAMGKDLPLSHKVSIEISAFLRGKELDKAIAVLNRVLEKKEAIPFKRYMNGAGHKPGKIMAGKYPIKAATEFLQLLTNVKANATNQGMTGTLVIKHIAANKANEPMRNRAKERIRFKRCHVEVIVVESEAKKATPKKSKEQS